MEKMPYINVDKIKQDLAISLSLLYSKCSHDGVSSIDLNGLGKVSFKNSSNGSHVLITLDKFWNG